MTVYGHITFLLSHCSLSLTEEIIQFLDSPLLPPSWLYNSACFLASTTNILQNLDTRLCSNLSFRMSWNILNIFAEPPLLRINFVFNDIIHETEPVYIVVRPQLRQNLSSETSPFKYKKGDRWIMSRTVIDVYESCFCRFELDFMKTFSGFKITSFGMVMPHS
jgi:hypothetical protein